jgi:hypothetical protein
MQEKDIQGPEHKQMTGQLRIAKDIAIDRHIAQFWDERHHTHEDKETLLANTAPAKYVITELHIQKSVKAIQNARTVGEVKRAAHHMYEKGLAGTHHQKTIQEAVSARKSQLRERKLRKGSHGSPWLLGDHYGF